ncbi:MAG TPA: NPCBM/NEW2 domain-containing protein [Planctomycetota bacterium]|jgi:hypothetical protein
MNARNCWSGCIAAAIALLLGNLAVAGEAEKKMVIKNAAFCVSVDAGAGTFSVQALPSEKKFIPAGKLSGSRGTAQVIPVPDKTFGDGEAIEVLYPDGNRDRLSIHPNTPFVLLRSTLHNGGNESAQHRTVKPVSAELDLGKPATELRALGTGGLTTLEKNPGSYAWLAIADPQTRSGAVAGWISHDRGSGVLFSKVENSRARIDAQIDYGRLRIPAGKDAETETLALGYFDDARLGMEAWADAVAKFYAIKLHPQPAGYCTWYHAGASSEKQLAEQSKFAAEKLAPFGFSVMQIDDGWQEGTGGGNGPKKVFLNFNPKGPYAGGMKATAENIKACGLTPGIWFMPFAGTHDDPFFKEHQDWFVKREDGKPYDTAWGGTCLDLTHAGAREYLRSVVQRIAKEWGYIYFKMDGMWTGSATKQIYVNSGYKDEGIGDAVFSNPEKTNIEAYRDGIKLVRETAGDGVFILGCCAPQNMRSFGGAFGLIDAMRVGPDNSSDWGGLTRGPLFASRNYHLNGRIWYNDPDPVYVRTSTTLPHAQLICSWVTISGNLNLSSEHMSTLPAERLDILKRTMPSHGLFPRPVDLFENEPARVWLLTDERGTAGQASHGARPRRDVIALYNWESKALTVELPLARMGMNAETQYVAFDFWANTVLPPFKGTLRSSLPKESCQILAVRPLLERPFLLSTSRHITQGIVDVVGEKWDDAGTALNGKSNVVASDPYELRVITPVEPKSWKVVKAELGADAAGAEIKFVQTGPLVRATITSPKSCAISWKIAFEPGPAVTLQPAKVTNLAAKATSFHQVVISWEGTETSYRVVRNDGIAAAVLAKVFTDDNVAPGTSYTYSVSAIGWTGKEAEAVAVNVGVPKIELPPLPPAPDVHLSDLKATKETTGFGQIGVNKSVDGKPLTVNGKKYEKGMGVHARSELTYACKKEYKQFVAVAGLDDEKRDDERPSVVFQVWADKEMLAESPKLTWRELSHWHFDVAIPAKTKHVRLVVADAGDGIASDHADWVDAGFKE